MVTDHDDESAEKERIETVQALLQEGLQLENYPDSFLLNNRNNWAELAFDNRFGRASIRFCYLLVPKNGQGALESFMLKALAEQEQEKQSVVDQVRAFIEGFTSEQYLKKRRERIKAELGISFNIFCPDKMFLTMMELIESIDWSSFDETYHQFDVLHQMTL